MYTIKRAADLVGVSEGTLRTWERRYGVGASSRTESGYRLYDDSAIGLLRTMHQLIAEGWSASTAAEEARRRDTARGNPVVLSPVADTTDLASAASAFDTGRLDATLDARFGFTSFEDVVDTWLLPALTDLGLGWESGAVSVAGEHFVAHGVTRRLAAAFDAAGESASGPLVVIGLPPGARHDLGLLAFATAARRTGLPVRYLGADVPADDWARAVGHTAVAAAVLAVPMAEDAPAVAEVVAAIEGVRDDLLIAVGGGFQDLAPTQCLRLGHLIGPAATSLAHRLVVARR